MNSTHAMTRLLTAATAIAAALSASAGLRSWEPSDYVQDGLVLNFDGIRNAGADVAHNPGAGTWVNLGSAGGVATFNSTADGSVWTVSGYTFGGASYATLSTTVSLTNTVTIQVVSAMTLDTLKGTASSVSWPMFIGGETSAKKDACNLYFSKSANNFTFKNVDGGNANFAAANWDQRYLNAIRNGNDKYIFSSVSRPASATVTGSQGDIGDITFHLGSAASNTAGTDGFNARYIKGEIKAIRLYDRVLSNDELAQNRALDEIRFFTGIPVTNAVVATSVSGAEGVETAGAYAVDEDGHTFRASPTAVIDGVTYACTGCTVAQWNSATGDWGAAEIRDGVFAVSVSSSDKVKITWQWEAATGSLDAGYVTDDLALRLDGIDNAGVGVHDASAAVWKDLSGNGRDAFLAGNADGTSHWTDKGFYFNFNAVFSTAEKFAFGTQHTFEVLMDGKRSDWWGDTAEKDILVPSTGPTGAGGIYYKAANAILCHRSDATTGSPWNAMPGFYQLATVTYLAALRDNAKTALITGTTYPETEYDVANGGIAASQNYVTNAWLVGSKNLVADPTTWLVGGRTTAPANTTKGTVKSVRLYNRLLTEAELAHNRAVDEARFFGKIPETGCVVVQSAIDGLEGRESSGIYFPDGWTFSAGAGTQTARGIEWQCAGYQLQTWDAASSAWGAQSSVMCDDGNVAEYTAAATSAALPSVRLTWLWKPVAGIRTAADYALADYAAGGMQLHLDGLLNAGTAHDSSATVWSDLSGNGRDATLAGNPSGESHWVDDGYFFASNAVFATGAAATFSLGHAYTMQTLGDVNFADNKDGSHNGTYVSPIDHISYGSIWLKGDGMGTVQHHTSDMTGAAWNLRGSVFVGLDGHPTYLTAIRNGNRAALVEGTAYPTTENTMAHQACMDWSVGSKDASAPATRWGVGALTGGGGGDPLYGTIKSVRLYDRMLSEDELAWNRNVDSARYFGALATTNVLVVANEFSGELAEDTATAYQVFGSHVFSGAAGANFVRVAALQADGTWGDATPVESSTYTYEAGISPATVRIEFRKTHPFMLVVR